MLVATLGVVEAEAPAIYEKMQPRAKVALTVRSDLLVLLLLLLPWATSGFAAAVMTKRFQVESVMKEAAVVVPLETSDLDSVQEIDLGHLAKASASMENNLRVRTTGIAPRGDLI